jgi:hypothetical protein
MKKMQGTLLPFLLLAGTGMAVVSLPVLANVEAECRQESEEYGIPPEQQEDYVTGCVMSRGGNYDPEPAVADEGVPGEAASPDDAGMGSNYTDEAGTDGSSLPE